MIGMALVTSNGIILSSEYTCVHATTLSLVPMMVTTFAMVVSAVKVTKSVLVTKGESEKGERSQ